MKTLTQRLLLLMLLPTTVWAQIITVKNDHDAGEGSLRQAIITANQSNVFTRIQFTQPMTIKPSSPLPSITQRVWIGVAEPALKNQVILDGIRFTHHNYCLKDKSHLARPWYHHGSGLNFIRDSQADSSGSIVDGIVFKNFCSALSVLSYQMYQATQCEPTIHKISNITIKNSQFIDNKGNASVDICNANQMTIENCQFSENTDGVEAHQSNMITIINNRFTRNTILKKSEAIELVRGVGHHVEGNHITGHDRGIALFHTHQALIMNNEFRNNNTAILMKYSKYNTVTKNNLPDQKAIATHIKDNHISNNKN